MNAGPKFEYMWPNGKKPIALSAPAYIEKLLNWVQELMDDEHLFPTKVDAEFPKNFKDTVKDIFRRLFRVYAHLYLSHFQDIEKDQMEAHLNTSFRHFLFFVEEFDLIDKKQLTPLAPLIQEMDAKYPKNP